MRINTNVSALNAQRQLGKTNAAVSQSITRLSSGFRINRAADDAAGLGIANKLRGDIRSMTQAARNGEQANSLAQIAEGAVSGVASMLDRMKELATQANSDTVDADGRDRLQAEFDALRSEIDRTANTTKFGSTQLLKGGFGNAVDTNSANSSAFTGGVHDVTISGTTAGTYTFANNATDGNDLTLSFTDVDGNVTTETVTLTADGAQSVSFARFGVTVETDASFTRSNGTDTAGSLDTLDIEVVAGTDGGSFMVGSSGAYGSDDLLSFAQINMATDANGLDLGGLDLTNAIDDANGAQGALSRIDDAVKKVNSALGEIGAFQNRIENAVANLKTGIENLSASESVIRDLDMAEEMTKFSKNQILAQAGTAMLAQANSSSQGVLQLLRG